MKFFKKIKYTCECICAIINWYINLKEKDFQNSSSSVS